ETESHHELSFVDRFQRIEATFDPEARRRVEESAGFSEDQTDPISTDDGGQERAEEAERSPTVDD
ncbi:MAG: hypothetical protein A07HB70_01050, partial [uncultured archaeon A07HB70]